MIFGEGRLTLTLNQYCEDVLVCGKGLMTDNGRK